MATGAGSPTRTSWARAADAICAAGNAQITALPQISTEATLIKDIRSIGQIATHGDVELAAVPRPEAERRSIASLLSNGQTEANLTLKQLLPAEERGDATVANVLAKTLGKLGNEYNALARSLGAPTCAVNPTPSGSAAATGPIA